MKTPMNFAHRLLAVLAAITLAAAATSASAQASLSVYGGYVGSDGIDNATTDTRADLGNAGSFMLVLGTDLDAARELQMQFAQQSSTLTPGGGATPFDLTVRYLHAGGTVFVSPPIGHGIYAVGGLGVTQFSPGTDGYGDEYKPSLNLGFGYSWPVSDRVLLRAEARAFLTLVNSSGGFMCSGGCVAVLKSDLFTQYGGFLGVTVRF
jgi:hypothetical protein